MGAIPSCPAALPKLARLGVSTLGTDSPINSWLGFTSFDPGVSQELLELGDNVNTGTLSSLEPQARLNRRIVAPRYEHHPTAAEWRTLLPWLLDGTESGSGTSGTPYAYPLANALSKRYVGYDDTQLYWNLKECGVDSWTVSASQGDPALKLSADLIGVDWDNVGTFPGGLSNPTDAPFIFTDSSAAVLVNGVSRKVASLSITVNKDVARDRFFNSTTIACAVSQNRKVSISLQFPWGLHSDLFALGSATSVAVLVTFTFGAKVLVFSMPHVRHQPEAPRADVPSEIMGSWTGLALASTPNDELSATLALA